MTTADVRRMKRTGMETRFVTSDVYCELITSRQRLERRDDHARGLRGLLDPDSGVCWVIPEQQLLLVDAGPVSSRTDDT